MLPIKLSPSFKDYIWGGNRLVYEFNKQTELSRVAESWELSAHKDGECYVLTGEYEGMKFSDYIAKNRRVLGDNCKNLADFPILIKLIDAKENLSVQVHPDDEYAKKRHGQQGKTEMWHVLDCEAGATLYYGFKNSVSLEQLEVALQNGTVINLLNKVEVKKGDTFFITPGTVHAIGKGILLCEVQQNSNVTYRLYDYDRVGDDGKKRPLHISDALAVTNCKPLPPHKNISEGLLADCDFFRTEKIRVEGKRSVDITQNSFLSLLVTDGDGELLLNDSTLKFKKGDSIFIPAQNVSAEVLGSCAIIATAV